jgi:hypothetical protein
MSQQKLTIVSVDNYSQLFGNTEYAVFTCTTSENKTIPVAVTHNLLERRGVNINLLDSLVTSTILVNDDVDSRTGEITSADERVNRIINGTFINERTGRPVSLLTVNSANGGLLKAELYTAETKDLASSIQAKVQTEKAKQKKIDSSLRLADRLRQALNKTEETVPSTDAVLETNEESPF